MGHGFGKFFALGAAMLLAGRAAVAQLAITEALSSASTNNTLGVTQGPDFWELTNFGTNTLDLTGYRWNDSDGGLAGADSTPFNGLTIGPGEVILFVQDNVPTVSTPEQFRAWWALPPTQQVVFYSGNGLSSDGDSVILWGPDASGDADVVDRADFGPASRGRSFTYDPADATFGVLSSNGVWGAFTAAQSDDVGSPGTNAGPVSLVITVHPTNQVGYAGFPVTFHAAARGLPRPKFQWRFNGVPLPGATAASLTLPSVQVSDAGLYSVVVTNGLQVAVSSNALLTVDTSPAAPTFVTTPASVEAYVGQTVTLSATAQGNPPPAFQWRSNGIALPGQTGHQLVLHNVQTNFTALYSVVIFNLAGTNTASAQVTVTPRPRFLITEVHSTGSSEFQDWWELTSFDTRPFNLKGYRFDDDSQSLAAALTITNDVVIQPGESIVLVETTGARPMSPSSFRGWWGSNNIPAHVKILIYAGPGIGFSSGGDGLYLWNAVATANSDFICGVTFGAASGSPRRAFVYNVDNPGAQTPLPGSLTLFATNGVNGAWAASNGDVGSPGRVIAPVLLEIVATGGGPMLGWASVPGRTYRLEARETLSAGGWTLVTHHVAGGDYTSLPGGSPLPARFYRVATVLPFPGP
ncbi:MAG: immunoglobulin domain-containing protein [Verrucomicrobiae bacterium]|nr:immunoglobulin domain-containing protein [Verrucomicrobiae bacterium]